MTVGNSRTTNILVAGIGGQGVMTASEVLAQAALAKGHDVKKTEMAGMAQRGGVVTSHVRFGALVLSPSIPEGEADLLLGLEAAEAMRWCGHLRPGGVAVVNTQRLAPPVVSMGLHDYPEDPVGAIQAAGITVRALDAGALALELGDRRLVNTIMLGAIAGYLPFDAEDLKRVIVERFEARKPELARLNERAFEAGRKAAGEGVSGLNGHI